MLSLYHARQKNDVRELNRRLEFLEQQIHGSEHASNSPRSVEESVEPEAETQAETYPDPSVPKENGKDCEALADLVTDGC
jgi:hypothetical protein